MTAGWGAGMGVGVPGTGVVPGMGTGPCTGNTGPCTGHTGPCTGLTGPLLTLLDPLLTPFWPLLDPVLPCFSPVLACFGSVFGYKTVDFEVQNSGFVVFQKVQKPGFQGFSGLGCQIQQFGMVGL